MREDSAEQVLLEDLIFNALVNKDLLLCYKVSKVSPPEVKGWLLGYLIVAT